MLVNKCLFIILICWGSASSRVWSPKELDNLIKQIYAEPSTELPDFGPEYDDIITPSVESIEIGTEAPVIEIEVEIQQCPPDESSFSKNDINVLVDYMANKMNVYEKINDSCFLRAESIRDKHINDINAYLRRIEDRPHHLKHILEDIAAVREKLNPVTNQIIDSLQEFSSYEIIVHQTLEHAQAVLKQLAKTKQICILMNCGQHLQLQYNEYAHNPSSDSQDLRYCSTLTSISDKVTASLTEFQNELIKNISMSLYHEEKYYTKNIDELKKYLKELALKQFGMTMYDILNIQDEYYHLSEALNSNNISWEIEEIKQNRLQIDYEVIKLERTLKKYENYCISCNQHRSVYRSLSHQDDDLTKDSEIVEDMVDKHIHSKLSEIKANISGTYTDIFKELHDLLNAKDLVNNYLANLKPIQDEITNGIIEESENLDKLKNSVSTETIDKVLELSWKSKEMLQTVQEELNSINSFIQ